jgi:hypothetical protein
MSRIKFKSIATVLSVQFLFACATATKQNITVGANSAWDFDHQLQYKTIQLDNGHYQLEVITNNKTDFSRMSAFLLRQSYLICRQYGYSLTMVKGVERFDFLRQSPNLIRSNLVAKLACPSQ